MQEQTVEYWVEYWAGSLSWLPGPSIKCKLVDDIVAKTVRVENSIDKEFNDMSSVKLYTYRA